MFRTPDRTPNLNTAIADNNATELPTSKLSAVTRAKNEIIELIPEATKNAELIAHKFNEYLQRVERLYAACIDERAKTWLEGHKQSIEEFRAKIEAIIHPPPPPGNVSHGKKSNICSSTASSASSARIKLAERRARVEASRRLIERETILKQKELELELEKKKLRQEEEELNLELLERQFQKLNICSGEICSERIAADEDANENSPSQRCDEPPPGDKANQTPQLPLDEATPAKKYNEECFARILENQNEISATLVQNQLTLSLPKTTITPFDGTDITEYKYFISTFRQTIESKCTSDVDRFMYLQQYTCGEAKRLVDSCTYYSATIGYYKAIQLLDKEYNNEHKVANSFLSKLHNWPEIKREDSKALTELSLYLATCNNYLENMTYRNQFQSPKELMKIVQKLPYKLRECWRRKTHEYMKRAIPVTFDVLVDFVADEASLLKQPIFSDISDAHKPAMNKGKGKSQGVKPLSVTCNTDIAKTDSDVKPKRCACCKKTNHDITECKFFKCKDKKDKIAFIKKLRLCFGCLKGNHIAKNCTKRLTCSICNLRHPTALHSDEPGKENFSISNVTHSNSVLSTTSNKVVTHDTKKIMYPVLPVKLKVRHCNEEIITNVILDSCSSDCWINESLLNSFSVSLNEKSVRLTTMSGTECNSITKVVNNVQLESLDGSYKVNIPVVYTKQAKQWPFDERDIPTMNHIKNFSHLKDVPFDFVDVGVGVLIGMNVPCLFKQSKIIEGESHEPFASLHPFGWAVNGPVNGVQNKLVCNKVSVSDNAEIKEYIDTVFTKDFIDKSPGLGISPRDENWLKKIETNVKLLPNQHYEIGLPFKSDPKFPDNRKQVYGCFTRTIKKFKRDPLYFEDYNSFMTMMLDNQFMEEVPPGDLCAIGERWYITHHGVYHKQKGKLRVVFNCSLKFDGTSLNDNLIPGPDLTNTLLGVLLRFRENKYAFAADLEKMFYQVRVPVADRNFMRFFWFNANDYSKITEYRICVHVFGATSSPSVACFALHRVATESSNEKFSDLAKQSIKQNFYVDDLLKSVPCEAGAISLINELITLTKTGGFNLTSFSSNSRTVLEALPGELLSKPLQEVYLINDELPVDRTLGIVWNPAKDTLGFKVKMVINDCEILTKRQLLKCIASVYDPLGLVAPVLIPAKRIFQEICTLKLDWDDQIPPHLLDKINAWKSNLSNLADFTVPRCVEPYATNTELHVFCDGSEIAYGSVAYVKCLLSDGSVSIALLLAKSRLTPISRNTLTTVPRIELSSAKLSVEVYIKLKEELTIQFLSEYFWTDSVTVLRYIKNESKRFQRFVANKVSFIRHYVDPEHWRYLPSKENPADLISRGASVKSLQRATLWREGPDFLRTNLLPVQGYSNSVPHDDPESKSEVTCSNIIVKDGIMDKFMNATSSYYKLKIYVSYLLRLRNLLLKKATYKHPVSVNELNNAECAIVKYVQGKDYGDLISMLSNGKDLPKKCSIKKLSPYLDSNQILRVGGRLDNSPVAYEVKHPIILPARNHIVSLLVKEMHIALGHLGRETILAKLREKYWIIGGNNLVRKIVNNCMQCRKYHGKPVTQIMSELPSSRTTGDEPAFTNVGIDCFGPFEVVRGRRTEKRYGVIFICLASKAIHIEMLHSLSTDSFINSLRRFISRRGNVQSIVSDNGTNFKGAEKELKLAFQQCVNTDTATNNWLRFKGIEWKFNPPYASHFGGIWERQIRSIRKVLHSILSEQPMKFTDELLNTLFCEVESILNNRPLTEVASDSNGNVPLTPNHLLLFNAKITFPPGLFNKSDSYCNRRWRQVQYLAHLFWLRWKREYLVLLQERQKWQSIQNSLTVGDLVLVMDQNSPRNHWPIAVVQRAIKDRFNRVRSVELRINKYKDASLSNFECITIVRPIAKVILLRESKELN